MKKVHYIGFYISEEEENIYSGNVPGKLKMRYVADKICEVGSELSIFSLAEKSTKGFYKCYRKVGSNKERITYSGGISGKSKIVQYLNAVIKKIQFVWYVIFCIKPSDIIILYHSISYTKLMSVLKKILKRTVICEVEEIYGYSATEDKPYINQEISNIKKMDKFILVNDYIPKELGLAQDDYCVSYGVIKYPEQKEEKFNDGKIHVVYAGTIEKRKLGAFSAVEAARYLPDDYIMHILGFGNEIVLAELNDKIETINISAGCRKVEYNGYLTGGELDSFLLKCDIGLSSNIIRPNFANNTFPSKVITYMCHNLNVTMGYAEAFTYSSLVKCWNFYYEQEPEKIACAITKTLLNGTNMHKELLDKVDLKLIEFLKEECR